MENESIESFFNSRASCSYNVSASIDMDLKDYGTYNMENGIPYVINDANPTEVQPYGSFQNPSSFQISKAYCLQRTLCPFIICQTFIEIYQDI